MENGVYYWQDEETQLHSEAPGHVLKLNLGVKQSSIRKSNSTTTANLLTSEEKGLMKRGKKVLNLVVIMWVVAFLSVTATEICWGVRSPESSESVSGSYSGGSDHVMAEGHSFIQLKNSSAPVGVYSRAGRIKRLYGEAFSRGATPEESAGEFLQANAHLLGVDPADLGDLKAQPIMYERTTGQYKFTGVFYSQYEDGIPVFGTRLVLLVRNEADFPLVEVSAELRNLDGFQPQIDQIGLDPGLGRASALRVAPSLTDFSEPEMVIWAGMDETIDQPKLAYSFVGDNGRPDDGSEPEKYLFVTDAGTGAILYQENLIIFEDVTGVVQGRATTGSAADFCEEELPRGMRWARVNIGTTVAYANANGAFVIPNSGTSPVTVESQLRGLWFRTYNQAGADALLSQSVTPPGPADFMHNDPNTDEFYRAQVNGYLQANIVRDFTLRYNPDYPALQQSEFPVYVNDNTGYCPGNAWYDGSSITFCRAASGYPNTAWSSVIHHEYGHHLVAMAGSGQGAYGEGMGDIMGLLILDESGTGFGFYGDCDTPLRDADNTLQYPCDGEIHYCGQLLSGCVWSTRNQLVITNPFNYIEILANLAVNAMLMHTGTSIDPSITIDYLTLDDDNGNIYDGTPHYNEIATGFGAHNMDAPELMLLDFTLPDGLPELISPSGGTTVRVEVGGVTAEPEPGTGVMFLDDGSGWQQLSMTEIQPNIYDAVFPAAECGTQVAFYFQAQTTGGQFQLWPSGAPEELFYTVAALGAEVEFADDFESHLGWTVENSPYLTDGAWNRGVPAGGGDRGDPPTDFDGSGQCYLTDNVYGNSDVDGGLTWLISPTLNVSEGADAQVHYALWYTNNYGDDPNNDLFKVYVSSNNGADWILVETIGPVTSSGWKEYNFMVGDFVTPTNEVKVRFEASDLGAGSVVEAGVDDFNVSVYTCGPGCGDASGDGEVTTSDVVYLINYMFKGGPPPECQPITSCGDVNLDDVVDSADIIYLINYMYRSGPSPCNPPR
jgi:hypothetical protein